MAAPRFAYACACCLLLVACAAPVAPVAYDGPVGAVDLARPGIDPGPDLALPRPDLAIAPPDLAFACRGDGDCQGLTPRCEVASGKCVPCLPANDNCPPGSYCTLDNNGYRCAPGCQRDTDCRTDGGLVTRACCKNLCLDTGNDNQNCGACGNGCAPGSTCCGARCVDLQRDPLSCGGCNLACNFKNAAGACQGGKCMLGACNQGFGDCNKVPDDGCEADLNSDGMNCLGCGKVCAIAHGQGGCQGGCLVARCDDGWGDCDQQGGNGCEQDLFSSTAHCGACGRACGNVANAVPACVQGRCQVGGCNGGLLDCDKQYGNGCEVDPTREAAHCGGCGKPCPAVKNGIPACAGGQCKVGSCNPPFQDCNRDPADGCESDTGSDIKQCGACGNACGVVQNGAVGCQGGKCVVASCNVGFADCNRDVADGCETDLRADIKNCGQCARICPAAPNSAPRCQNGVCGIEPCGNPFSDCNGLPNDGCETNISTDLLNCGGCRRVCATVPNGLRACVQGQCKVGGCNGSYRDCNGQYADGCEANTSSSLVHCGLCGRACAVANGTPACTGGACVVAACNPGYRDCANGYADGCETNVSGDLQNCGACGLRCQVQNGTPSCQNAACRIANCSPGFADCRNGYADGCETNTNADVQNCGACARACPGVQNGSPGCQNGACGLAACNAPYLNCDGNAANGCEVNSATDAANCGACGNACAPGIACNNGQCKDAVLIVGAPGGGQAWNNDVQSKLVATGAFAKVDIFNAQTGTPSLAVLRQYQAALVYSDFSFADSTTLGNNLADYFDQGGRVVVATFANASVTVAGRWSTGGYPLIQTGAQEQPNVQGNVQIVEPGSPLVTSVVRLSATAAYRSTGGAINGGVIVARWADGKPLVVRGSKGGRHYATLNFFPPSSVVRNDFWTGDGAALLRNALLYKGYCHSIVGKNGVQCQSGRTEFCDGAPIVATSEAQARLACETCYGAPCFRETADCAGVGYGPKPAGQYVGGDAYFGAAAGCSGGAGRIWAISSSFTTYGRWAP